MLKLNNLFALTLFTVPLLSFSAQAQGFEPFPGPSGAPAPSTSPSQTGSSQAAQSPYFRSRAKNLARQAAERANGGLSQYRAEPKMSGPALTAPYVENADGSLTFTFKGGPPGPAGRQLTTETIATVLTNGTVKLDYNGPIRGSNIGGAGFPAPGPATTPPPRSVPAPATAWPAPPAPAAPIPQAPIPQPAPIPSQPPSRGLPILTPQSSRPQPRTIRPFAKTLPKPTIPGAPTFPSQPIAATSQTVQPLPASGDQALAADLFLARAKNLARQAAIQANGGLSRYRPDPRMFGPASQAPHVKNTNGSITFKFRGGSPGAQTLSLESEITVAQNNAVIIQYNGPVRQ